MKPSHHTIKPLLHKPWISSRSRAGEQKKKKIQPSFCSVIKSTLCWAAAEYRAAQRSLHNPRQDIHYSHKPPSQQNRRAEFNERAAISSGSDFMLQAVFPRLRKPIHPNPHPCFSIVPGIFPLDVGPQTWLNAESGHHTQEGELYPPWAAKRRGIGFHHLTRALFAWVCVPIIWFHPWGKMLLCLYNTKLCNNTSSPLPLC